MAECKDIDKALANLARKIDEQSACCNLNKQQIADLNRRIRDLERGNNKQEQNKPIDLSAITKRLDKLEGYCDSIEQLFAQIGNLIKPIIDIFK